MTEYLYWNPQRGYMTDAEMQERCGYLTRVSQHLRQRGPSAMLPDVLRCDRCHRPMAECHRPLGVGSCR